MVAAALAGLASAGSTHEVWIERDVTGPARIYLGEPEEVLPDGGDPEFVKLKAPKLLTGGTAASVRRAGFIEVAVPAGDVRAWDDSVFTPWGAEGKKENIVYYARAGRSEPTARLPFEIAPASAGSDRFVVTRDGKPVAGGKITVVTPTNGARRSSPMPPGRSGCRSSSRDAIC